MNLKKKRKRKFKFFININCKLNINLCIYLRNLLLYLNLGFVGNFMGVSYIQYVYIIIILKKK